MGQVVDKWTSPGPSGRRVRNDRYGRGKRWLARWDNGRGGRDSRAFERKTEAEAHLSHVEVARHAGTYAAPSATTVAEWAAVWESRQLHMRPATLRRVSIHLRVHIVPGLGRVRLRDLSKAQVQAWVVDLSAGLAPSTVRAVVVTLRSVLLAAVEERLIASSPARGVRLPAVTRAKVAPMTPGHVQVIADAVPARWRALVLLGAASGLRVSEVLGLSWDRTVEVTLPDGQVGGLLTVDRQLTENATAAPAWGPPKTAASDRRVLVDARVWRVLGEHRAVHGVGPGGLIAVGSAPGRLATRTVAGDTWRRARPEWDDWSGWHALRHFHASVLISAGVSVRAVADRLGHDDPSVTLSTYAHLMPSDEARSLAAVEASLWG